MRYSDAAISVLKQIIMRRSPSQWTTLPFIQPGLQAKFKPPINISQ
ncbi:hypothetical protein H6G76_06110 [Nostoc sp. FACHB-152]|nr:MULTISPECIES: hypothetical protein [unclassified Nostoc]MBD2446747.1 hypothetical protein [Nostoc sp. FACHB-152]MBD2466595.1 hypothetical protein [Nostoc sp. FACHB-145]